MDKTELLEINISKLLKKNIFDNFTDLYEEALKMTKEGLSRLEPVKRKIKLTKRYKLKRRLKKGDIKAAYSMVRNRYKFNQTDVDNFRKIINRSPDKNIIEVKLQDGSTQYLTITDNSWDDIEDMLKNLYDTEYDYEQNGSDVVQKIMAVGVKSIKLLALDPERFDRQVLNNKAGRFFPFINKTIIDLTRYQIIKDIKDANVLKKHCLLHVLELYKIKPEIINDIKLTFETGYHFPKKRLKIVSDKIKKTIILYHHRNKAPYKVQKTKYGKYKDFIEIAIYQDHYFIYEKTNYTMKSIKKYDEIKHHKNFNNIIKIFSEDNKKYKLRVEKSSNKRYKINSLQLIKNLFDGGHFVKDDQLLSTITKYQEKYNNPLDIPLNNISDEQKIFELKEKENKPKTIFYADCESLVNNVSKNHEGFMCAVVSQQSDDVKLFIKKEKDKDKNYWFKSMLYYVVDKTVKNTIPIIYFHNLKYDFNLFKNFLHIIDICQKDGMYYEVSILFNKKKIIIRDSYKLIPVALKGFNKMFKLPEELNKKEAIGYTYYNEKNIYENKASIDEYKKHLKKDDIDKFNKIVKTRDNKNKFIFNFNKKDNTFDHIKYYKYYLKYDVIVLKKGLEVFKNKINEITENKCCIYEFLTISSLTNYYMSINGAFDGLYQTSSNLREYLSKAIYGGRVCVNPKYKKKLIKEDIDDYDACSLYPSAINRLCRESGLFKGKAKRLNKNHIKKMNKSLSEHPNDYFVCTIKIKKINKKQQIPFICYRDENNICNYINDLPNGKPFLCVIDKFTLQDYIKFHKIDYEIIDGIYYNSGLNKKMGNIIEKLYNKRLLEKKNKNQAMQQTIKLMLNSAYGKTIIKKSTIKKVIITNKVTKKNKNGHTVTISNFDRYIYNHYNQIKMVKKLNDKQSLITVNNIDNSFNLSQVGCAILSYSKRIMNEVMSLANDNNINIYYQDTDSMHITKNKVSTLEKLYKEKYNKSLQGKNMEQFHGDFDMENACGSIKSIKSIFLGKKSYIDILQSVDKNNNIITDSHIRLKGITKEGIKHAIDQCGSEIELFKRLASGKKYKFLLNPQGKTLFEYNTEGVKTKDKFERVIKF